MYLAYILVICLSSILGMEHSQRRPRSFKTRVIWLPGIYRNRNKLSKDAGRSSDFTNLSFPEMGPHAMSFSLMEKLIQIEQVGEETPCDSKFYLLLGAKQDPYIQYI